MISKTDLQEAVWAHAFNALADLDDLGLPTPLDVDLPELRLALHLEAILILCAPLAVDARRPVSTRLHGTGMTGVEQELSFGE